MLTKHSIGIFFSIALTLIGLANIVAFLSGSLLIGRIGGFFLASPLPLAYTGISAKNKAEPWRYQVYFDFKYLDNSTSLSQKLTSKQVEEIHGPMQYKYSLIVAGLYVFKPGERSRSAWTLFLKHAFCGDGPESRAFHLKKELKSFVVHADQPAAVKTASFQFPPQEIKCGM